MRSPPSRRTSPPPSLRLAWMDLGFAAERCGELLARHGIVQELVGTVGRQGFVVEPRRWKVEQTFGCLQRYRRLRVDDEMSNETSRHTTVLASLFMTGMQYRAALSIFPSWTDRDLCYPRQTKIRGSDGYISLASQKSYLFDTHQSLVNRSRMKKVAELSGSDPTCPGYPCRRNTGSA